MLEKATEYVTKQALKMQDEHKCWNVLAKDNVYYPQLNYYVPTYSSTLWTLVLLADTMTKHAFTEPLNIISEHFYDANCGIYSLGKSHFPIPCLNGNMLYLHFYFQIYNEARINSIIDFFAQYQRFDEGDFRTPKTFPYYNNQSCYGKHTCYWGVVKLLKGLTFIPRENRSHNAQKLINNCIDFILLHEVCYSSHDKSKYLHTNIKNLTFPNMYQSDFLEILWLLARENVRHPSLERAVNLLRSKMKADGTWEIERSIKNMIIPIGKRSHGNDFITHRALQVLNFHDI